jgi:hypothetical protein
MRPETRPAGLARNFPLLTLCLILSCSANHEARVMPELLARKPVCLTLEWEPNSRPRFLESTAPDTMLLIPNRGKQLGYADTGGAEGRVALAPSQQDRKGGGWIWWTRGDTLWISSRSPTMDDLVVRAARPSGRDPADWRGVGMAASEHGRVGVHPYKCKELSESVP